MCFADIDLTRLFLEMVFFAVLGLGFEVIFTSITDFRKDKRGFLMGYSSLWYAPLYAFAPLFLYLTSCWLFMQSLFLRGVIYALVIFVLEYLGMLLLRKLLGASPSEEHYYKSRWNIHGLVRLDYFPAFVLMGWLFEVFFRLLH